jgi:alkyl sulfatase BDS1-like metallo-beta-lactamase superfamily hydrolase
VDDFEQARRGLVASFDPPRVEDENGRTVWELESYAFLDSEPPATANPSLWRQSQLCRIAGLFELAPGFYQLRGFDLSNMHVVEGLEGIVVIDPLVSAETAATALALYREHRGDRPVTGLVYTHSHVDHFGGAKGIVSEAEIESRRIPVLAPAGFLHHAVSENVFSGTAMGRRAGYMYGALLPRGPEGQIGSGLGQTTSLGTITLIPPNLDVVETGQEEVVDGVRMSFQLTPGTEAPAEMNIHFPDARVLCIADNAARSMHNILTPRGALVRDPRVWAHYLDQAIELFATESDVLFAGHHWPCWGSEQIVDYLEKQRDLYTYLHDQTLRLLNQGHTGPEIAELIELPPSLAEEWHCREYYGSISHNTKAIYQRYMGWFDGNPAHLWEHPPVEQSRRYVEFMGGAEAVLEKARASFKTGDYRWVAEVVNHVVFAEPENTAARELQAETLEQLGYGAENATWRNFFLMSCARASRARRPRPLRPTYWPGSPSASCSTQWRSASTAPAPPSSVCGSTGPSPTPTSSTRSPSATASSATAPAATIPPPRPPSRSSALPSTSSCSKPPTSASWPRAAASGSRATASSSASCSACSTSPTRASPSSPRIRVPRPDNGGEARPNSGGQRAKRSDPGPAEDRSGRARGGSPLSDLGLRRAGRRQRLLDQLRGEQDLPREPERRSRRRHPDTGRDAQWATGTGDRRLCRQGLLGE